MSLGNKNLLLTNDAAREVYAAIEYLPVIDIHTHVNLKLVLDNDLPSDPWTALCAGDHYVSSIIESLGQMNRATFYDPKTEPYAKWEAYAAVFPSLIGNHVRDWMRLTLISLGVGRPFNSDNAKAIWDQLSEKLQSEECRPCNLFKDSAIALMSTTDNPVDPLDQIDRAHGIFGAGYWVPAWRPDPFFNLQPGLIKAKSWVEWISDLERVTDKSIKGDFKAFREALRERHDFFANHGCRASDYGVTIPAGYDVPEERALAIFDKASRDQQVDQREALDFQAFMMRFSMDLDFDKGWVSQIHYGAARNQRNIASELGGLDSGCDTIDGYPDVVHSLHDLLNHFDRASGPAHKILIYSLAKGDWEKIAGLSRIFPCVYAGVSWWYFDSVSGMLEFMRTVPELGAGFRKTGPFVTDARNIYSLVPRSEVYRRCLATVLSEHVQQRGESVEDAITLARNLCTGHPQQLISR